jgi:uncharacterized protein YciI
MDDSTPEEDKLMSDHFAYLKSLLDEGTLILAGPALGPVFGLIVFEAEDEAAARQLIERDPSVAAGLQTPELYPFRASLTRTGPARSA